MSPAYGLNDDEHEVWTNTMVGLASEDWRMQTITKWLVSGNVSYTPGGYLESLLDDHDDFTTEIGRYYQLDSTGVDKAFDICEANVAREATHA